MKLIKLILFFSLFNLLSCSDDSGLTQNTPVIPIENLTGTGFFEYSDYSPFNGKLLKIYYHIPENSDTNTEIVFAFHGNGRNAKDYRDAMILKSNQYNFIIIAPEFSYSNFPGGDKYNLANVYVDGDNPTPSTLNDEDEWTFSVVEPLFDYFKNLQNNSSLKYHIFGHSAGGQFVHRFLMFKTNTRTDKVIISAPGWYTCTDYSATFPYGFSNSILENISLENLFDNNLTLLIGDLDNDPNASALRHNEYADAQGLNRFDRANYFFNKANEIAVDSNIIFQWSLVINQGADHSFTTASDKAADLIFN